jgi:hypothetical protein
VKMWTLGAIVTFIFEDLDIVFTMNFVPLKYCFSIGILKYTLIKTVRLRAHRGVENSLAGK